MAKPKIRKITKDYIPDTEMTTINLPGMGDIKVIVSRPALIRQNSSKMTKK